MGVAIAAGIAYLFMFIGIALMYFGYGRNDWAVPVGFAMALSCSILAGAFIKQLPLGG